MSASHALYQMMRADFLERVRRRSFLMVLACAVWLAVEVQRGHVILQVDGYRGVNNSAWLGSMMSLVTTTFLSLFGFYIVKNTVARDIQTGVGQVLATTRMTRLQYAFGKVLSNLAVLMSIVMVLVLAALLMRFTGGVGDSPQLAELLVPFVLIALPAMALVAAAALVFELIPWLRGGLGNALYFWAWTGLLAIFVIGKRDDPLGFTMHMNSIEASLRAQGLPMMHNSSLSIGGGSEPKIFHWEGIRWTGEILLARLSWLLAALGLTAAGSFIFDRFDPDRGMLPKLLAPQERAEEPGPAAQAQVSTAPIRHLTPLARTAVRNRFDALLGAELKLMLRGVNIWWGLVLVGMLVASFLIPIAKAHGPLLAGLWIWPLLVWSQMGARESFHRTDQMVFSGAFPLFRQLPATWLAGFLLALLAASGVLVRLALAGSMPELGAVLVGALFIPSLAVALGAWSSSPRLFEILYLLVWYAGPLNRIPSLDFSGQTEEALHSGAPLLFLGLSAGLLVAAFVGRSRRIQC